MRQEPARGKGGEVALREFALGGLEFRTQAAETFLRGLDELVEALLALDGDEVGDGVLMFATPVDESRLGDVELGGYPGEGPALDAEFDEFVYYFRIFHKRKQRVECPRHIEGQDRSQIFLAEGPLRRFLSREEPLRETGLIELRDFGS